MIQTADTEHSLPQPVLPGEAMAIRRGCQTTASFAVNG